MTNKECIELLYELMGTVRAAEMTSASRFGELVRQLKKQDKINSFASAVKYAVGVLEKENINRMSVEDILVSRKIMYDSMIDANIISNE